MKKIIGIVSEYNPFHEGHKYHIEESRRMSLRMSQRTVRDEGSEEPAAQEEPLVICCMSGDFVQRGEWAILPKHERAAAAVRGGADLVIELPLPWSVSSAEGFAEGAVSVLMRMGITHLSFGSECGDIRLLEKAAERLTDPELQEKISRVMKAHPELPYAAARGAVLEREPDGEMLKTLLESPNNLLGAEYIKALCKLNEVYGGAEQELITVLTVKRGGSVHDGPGSAKELRERMRERREGVDNAVLELAAVSRLRMLEQEDFLRVTDAGNGVGHRIYDAVRSGACTIEEICRTASTKSIPYARARRVAMQLVLGIPEELTAQHRLPPYARVLAANAKGRQYLAELRRKSSESGPEENTKHSLWKISGTDPEKNSNAIPDINTDLDILPIYNKFTKNEIPVITLSREIRKLDPFSRSVFLCGVHAKDFYNMGFPEKIGQECGEDWRLPPCML